MMITDFCMVIQNGKGLEYTVPKLSAKSVAHICHMHIVFLEKAEFEVLLCAIILHTAEFAGTFRK